jgi:hypothetical protein
VTSPGGGTAPGPGLGSAAEEAARLFEAVQDWARRSAPGGSFSLGEHIATGSAECQLCPVCQLIGLVRATRPEVAEHLADAAASLLAAVRAAVVAHEREWSARRAAPVERIDIG